MGWGDDERVTHDPPNLWDADVVLYRHDGTPLKRQIGFKPMVQMTTTCPPIYKTSGKPKKKGK